MFEVDGELEPVDPPPPQATTATIETTAIAKVLALRRIIKSPPTSAHCGPVRSLDSSAALQSCRNHVQRPPLVSGSRSLGASRRLVSRLLNVVQASDDLL